VKTIVVGLGVQGAKRLAVAGADVVATVDPFHPRADYKGVEDVPLDAFTAALVCTPDAAKLDILEYLLSHGKHVLVEKPLLAPRADDLHRLARMAAEHGAVCYTAYNHRFEPHLATLHARLRTGELGKVYLAKLFYGNGTAADVRQSPWRDAGLGVLSDLGSHLLDMVLFLFGRPSAPIVPWACNRFENRAFDHAVIAITGDPVITAEMTLLSWRNTFSLDVLAEHGSAHVRGLCKWGPSVLTVRRRVRPSGKPTEEASTLEQPDPTWRAEYAYFREMCAQPRTNLDNDVWINGVLGELARTESSGPVA